MVAGILVASLSIAAPPSTIASAIADAEYAIGPVRDGETWQAPNRAHGFRALFSQDGVTLVPRSDDKSWRWGVRLAGWGGASAPTVAGNEIVYGRGSLVERYVNDKRGLEQIFEIDAPPVGERPSRGQLALDLVLSGN